MLWANLAQVTHAEQGHRSLQLPVDTSEHPIRALLAVTGQAIEQSASEQNAVRAQCERLDHIGPVREAAIDEHCDIAANSARDIMQHFYGSGRVVQLSSAVVR